MQLLKTTQYLIKLTLLSALMLPKVVFAGPPFVTDDPEPVDDSSWEINYAVSKTWRDGGTSVAIPSIDINYGLSQNIQLHAQPKYSYEQESGSQHFGIDNTEIGVKYRFFDQELNDQRWMLGIYPIIQLPTGNKVLGETRGKTQAFLPLWGEVNTENWTIYGGAGYRLNQGIDSKNSVFLGITALYKINEDLKLGAEIYRESATVRGGNFSSGYNFGGIYNMTSDYHLLFSLGQALNNIAITNQLSAYLALQVIY